MSRMEMDRMESTAEGFPARLVRASQARTHRCVAFIGVCCALLALNGCAVVMVAGAATSLATTAVGVGVSAVGLAADAAVGTVRLGGKAVGAMLPDGDKP